MTVRSVNTSYGGFTKYVADLRSNALEDHEMQAIARSQLLWYNQLRDLRDYTSHTSSLGICFYEAVQGILTILVHQTSELGELVESTHSQFLTFLASFDEIFARRVN